MFPFLAVVLGETIKNWRSRYFLLYEDGTLAGYRVRPEPSNRASEPLNNFTVKGCQIMKTDRPKPFTFVIRGLQWTRVIERTFYVESEAERESWIEAIENVAETLHETKSQPKHVVVDQTIANTNPSSCATSTNTSENFIKTSQNYTDDNFSNKFDIQGISYGRSSGKRKVVSGFTFSYRFVIPCWWVLLMLGQVSWVISLLKTYIPTYNVV